MCVGIWHASRGLGALSVLGLRRLLRLLALVPALHHPERARDVILRHEQQGLGAELALEVLVVVDRHLSKPRCHLGPR